MRFSPRRGWLSIRCWPTLLSDAASVAAMTVALASEVPVAEGAAPRDGQGLIRLGAGGDRLIDLDRDGDVWILRMYEGENRFNRRWLDAFNAALDRVEATEGPAALVTTGEREFYTNGMDLDWLATISGEAAGFLVKVSRLLARLLGFPVATVAAVNGHALPPPSPRRSSNGTPADGQSRSR